MEPTLKLIQTQNFLTISLILTQNRLQTESNFIKVVGKLPQVVSKLLFYHFFFQHSGPTSIFQLKNFGRENFSKILKKLKILFEFELNASCFSSLPVQYYKGSRLQQISFGSPTVCSNNP